MKAYTVYRVDTGEVRKTLVCSSKQVAANVPEGHDVVEGHVDRRLKRIDPETKLAVDRDDDPEPWRKHEFDSTLIQQIDVLQRRKRIADAIANRTGERADVEAIDRELETIIDTLATNQAIRRISRAPGLTDTPQDLSGKE